MRVGSILIFNGWLIRASVQLACIQCTSSIRRVSSSWDHSCLDATLTPVSCEYNVNQTKTSSKNCLSALYRLGKKKNEGVHIHRGCSMIENVVHECDPPARTINIDKTFDFFCTRTCSEDGCNQHTVNEIASNANGYFPCKVMTLLLWMYMYFFFFV